jgi:exocyst complex component 5
MRKVSLIFLISTISRSPFESFTFWVRTSARALIPLASSNITIRRDMTNYSSTNISALEKKVNHIFQAAYEIIISSTSHRLSKQRKNDFKLRKDDGSLTNLQTEPCRNVTSFWNHAYQAIHPILEGRNNDLFFTELGLGLHSLLLEHFKKFAINAAGGFILTKYINLIQL